MTKSASKMTDLVSLWQDHKAEPIAADAIYATLREAIMSGLLPAGERLTEVQLATLFNRSRTPVREAILRLESAHLAKRSPRRGFVVTPISLEEILEMQAVREALYGLAARLAAQVCLSKDVDQLKWIDKQLWKAGEHRDYRRMTKLNNDFHEAIARLTHNGCLLHFTRQAHDRVRLFTETTYSYPGRMKEAAEEHEALLAALARQDPDAAERIARAHVLRAAEIRIAMRRSTVDSL